MEYLLLSKKTKQLKKKQIYNICKLKNSFWNYGFKSNIAWFKKNVKNYDVHNLIYYNSKLIGYTRLGIRTFYLGKTKKKYVNLDTLIVEKKYRNKGVSHFLMDLNIKVIKKNKKISFLICFNNLVNFYKKFGWKIMPKKVFSIGDYNWNSNGMYFDSKLIKKKKYIFYFYK
tara:strand:+ start:2970 stop:3482 length:513 start_codon:yes stop_codon:yes gene_type:complete